MRVVFVLVFTVVLYLSYALSYYMVNKDTYIQLQVVLLELFGSLAVPLPTLYGQHLFLSYGSDQRGH